MVGDGIVSIGWSNSTLRISATQSNQAFSAQGGSSAFQTLTFTNSNNVSFSNTGGSLWGSYALNVSATGGTSNALSGLTFKDGNGVSFGLSTGAGVGTITASVAVAGGAQTGISGIADSANTQTVGTVSFANSNGISFGLSTGANTATLTASYTVPSIAGLISAINISDSATSENITQLVFSNAHGVSFGLATAGGGPFATLTGSVAAQSAQTMSWAATSNTAGNTSGMSWDARSFTAAGYGIASVGFSTTAAGGSSFVVSASQTVQTQASGGIAGTATAITGNASITLNSGGLSFNGSGLCGTNTASTGGNFAWTVNSSGISLNGSNIAGTTTAVTGSVSVTLNTAGYRINASHLAGDNTGTGSTTGGMAFAINSSGITISNPYRTRYIYPDGNALTSIGQFGNATMSIQYLDLAIPVTATRVDALVSMSHSTSAGAGTQTYNISAYAIVYTKNVNTLSSLSSGSTQTTYTLASNTAGQTQYTQAAIRPVSVPVNINMPAGEYFVGFNFITANTAGSATFSMMGGSMAVAQNYAETNSQTATSVGLYGGMGIRSAATTGMPTALSLSDINQTGTALAQANIALVFRNA